MPKKTIKQTVTEEFVRLHEDKPSRTIARLLVEQYPEAFTSVEAARSSICRIRGVAGKSSTPIPDLVKPCNPT